MSFEKTDWGPLLMSLVQFNKSKVIVEVGVCVGDSTDYLCQGAKFNDGYVYGFDLWDVHGLWNQFPQYSTQEQVEIKLKNLGHNNFLMHTVDTKTDKFKNLIKKIKPIDFAFIDACHSYEGISNDFNVIFPCMADGGIIVFHDTSAIDGCREFIIDLRTTLNDGSFDIIDFPYGGFNRRCGVTILKKRTLNHGAMIDEICGSPSTPDVIYKKEKIWLSNELAKFKK